MVHIMLPVPKARKKIMRFHSAWSSPSLKKSGISEINIRKAKISNCNNIRRGNLRVTNIGYQSVLTVLNYSVIVFCKRSRLPE